MPNFSWGYLRVAPNYNRTNYNQVTAVIPLIQSFRTIY